MTAAFVMDPLSTILVNGDSSFVFMEEAVRRGHAVWHTTPGELFVRDGRLFARVREILPRRPEIFEHVAWHEQVALDQADIVFMRKDPPFDINYIRTTYLLDTLVPHVKVVNAPAGLRDVQEKLWLLRMPELAPRTLVTDQSERIRAFLAEEGGKCVAKPWDGNGGRGVFVLRQDDPNLGVILETLTAPGAAHVLVQPYLEAIKDGDKRILLVDGEPKAGFLRIPSGGDHRGNMHVGARIAPCDLSKRDLEICSVIGPLLKKAGQIFVGIDVIGDRLTEVNVTSPTGIQEANRFYGTRLESDVFDAIERIA